jgi:diguanylate cyclase (GGDEF)-like protein
MDVQPVHATPVSSWRRQIDAMYVFALASALVVAVLTHATDDWRPATLAVIAVLAITSELLAIHSENDSYISGGFLGILLTAVLCGGGPAVAMGMAMIAVGWVRSRESPRGLVFNLANYAWLSLTAGLAFHGLLLATGAHSGDAIYFLLVFVAFVVGLTVNFSGFAGFLWAEDGVSVAEFARTMVAPVMSAELASAALTVAAAWVAFQLHLVGLVMFGIVLVIFQYLLGELLRSRQRSRKLQRIATTDELTGLVNRERFSELVTESIVRATESTTELAVMLIDLDRFKEVNDTLGHLYGDKLLQDLGPRLLAAAGPHGVVARLGGDEFALLFSIGCGEIEDVVGRLQGTVAEPFSVDELSLEVGASIGVARFPTDGSDSQTLLRCADIAMYAAKEAQVDYKLYAADQDQHSVRRLSVLSDIRHALTGDQIVVHYQPIIDVEDRRVMGAEGLVRWEHPEHGLIPPGAFVQTVEQTGLIGPLTRHVLEHAIAECAAWRASGRDLSVAVNLSVRNLLDRDLPREIERMLDHHHVPASALQLEITESMIMSDPERAMVTVGRLSELGVRLSVDDFGTGYSSLANLRRLPIDELKIDRSFVSPMLQDESDLIIVRSTINLGHDLGLKIIAEGVEDQPTLERLATLGCDLAQGYHLSRPMAARAFTAWLAEADPPPSPASTARGTAHGGWAVSPSGLLFAAPEDL